VLSLHLARFHVSKDLIVNADDFGWTDGVNRGILEAHRHGIVTSTSLLANSAAFERAVELARATQTLGVGVHLNLSDGPPVAGTRAAATLLNAKGVFRDGPESLLLKIASRRLSLDQVEKEWDAQICKIRSAGITPTHLDGHKHVHMLPGLFEIAVRLAKRHDIRAMRISHEAPRLRAALSSGGNPRRGLIWKQAAQARGIRLLARDARTQAARSGIATAEYFCGIAQTGVLTKEGLARLLRSLSEGPTELMCHPGYADHDLRNTATRLQQSREQELDILTDAEIRNLVASEGIRLIDYGRVAGKV
jgi:chitin disaccharide deacetylase